MSRFGCTVEIPVSAFHCLEERTSSAALSVVTQCSTVVDIFKTLCKGDDWMLFLKMLELVAEIAVLEEEVIWLEEQVVTYMQNLNHDAVFACSKKKSESLLKHFEQVLNQALTAEDLYSETTAVSIGKSASNSSNLMSDMSSLSLDKTSSTSSDINSSSTSSDIYSDQTGQTSTGSSGKWKSNTISNT
ncbi:uncharacterized protein LOC141642585 [Silene latifolia]|uniref:uncharacterized protein LOC141642585 n=1 Tax=Silene latifolia TaxID=37657 RepID=UPI003D789F55